MYRSFISAALLVSLWGCGGADTGKALPKTVPVTGTVKLDGQPIEGAAVMFVPSGDTKGIECVGRTDSTGVYSLKQLRGADGAPLGTYKVVINRFLKNGKPVTATDGGGGGAGIIAESLPPKYSNSTMTTLKATVAKAGDKIDFDLKSK